MKKINDVGAIEKLFSVQALLSFILIIFVVLTAIRLKKIEIPEISDRDLIFWLTEIN